MTQTDSADLHGTIDVVCDHCSTGYHVSITHFAHSFKHQFRCPSCNETWDEYLDIPVWESIRAPAQQLLRQEEEEKQKALEAEMQQIRAQEAKERADREAQEQAKRAAEEAAEKEIQQQAQQEAEELAAEAEAAERALQEAQEAETLKAEASAEAETTKEKTKKSAKNKKKKKSGKENDPVTPPKKFIGKVLTLINPIRWGQFSIAPLVFGILILILVYIGSAGYFYVQRAEIVQANPLAAGPYHAVGIPVSPVDGLDVRIADIERQDIKIPGEQTQYTFNIRAKVRNFSSGERRLPFLRFSVLNIDGERLDFWDVNLTGRVLQNNEEINVATLIPEELIGDERVESFVARLISKAEREYLGVGIVAENIAATSTTAS